MAVLPFIFSFNYSLPSFYNLLSHSIAARTIEIMNDRERERERVCVSVREVLSARSQWRSIHLCRPVFVRTGIRTQSSLSQFWLGGRRYWGRGIGARPHLLFGDASVSAPNFLFSSERFDPTTKLLSFGCAYNRGLKAQSSGC